MMAWLEYPTDTRAMPERLLESAEITSTKPHLLFYLISREVWMHGAVDRLHWLEGIWILAVI
jgi:hypothetical protein